MWLMVMFFKTSIYLSHFAHWALQIYVLVKWVYLFFFSTTVVMNQKSLLVSRVWCPRHYILLCSVGMVKDKKCFCLAVLMDGKERYLLFEGAVCIVGTFSAKDEISRPCSIFLGQRWVILSSLCCRPLKSAIIIFRAAPHVSVRMLLCFTAVIYFLSFFSFFISASLISAVSPPIWLKFGVLTGSWCNLWSPVPNGG